MKQARVIQEPVNHYTTDAKVFNLKTVTRKSSNTILWDNQRTNNINKMTTKLPDHLKSSKYSSFHLHVFRRLA